MVRGAIIHLGDVRLALEDRLNPDHRKDAGPVGLLPDGSVDDAGEACRIDHLPP
jgi:hypothetical protein